jgi:hypothetical protein
MLSLIQSLQHTLTAVCFVTAWVVVGLVLLTIWTSISDARTYTNQMHQIPCSGCQFFTNTYYLKCTVRPTSALTEDAINCADFCPKDIPV